MYNLLNQSVNVSSSGVYIFHFSEKGRGKEKGKIRNSFFNLLQENKQNYLKEKFNIFSLNSNVKFPPIKS